MGFFGSGGIGAAIGQFFGYILWLFFDLSNNYIFAVVCFTIVIKAIVFPFELKSRKAMAKSAKLNVKRTEIQKKYKNNKQKETEELTKLYAQENINPLGGCFPQLVPMISFLGIYYAIIFPLTNMFHIAQDKVSKAIELLPKIVSSGLTTNSNYMQLEVVRHFPKNPGVFTMFSPEDVSNINDFNQGFNLFSLDLSVVPKDNPFFSPAWILPILCIATMILSVFITQKINPSANQEGTPGCMKFSPYIMSVVMSGFFLVIVINAPSAIGFYYVVSNVLGIVQSIIIVKFFSIEQITAKEEAKRIARLELEEQSFSKKWQ